jgi:hypothetical protein
VPVSPVTSPSSALPSSTASIPSPTSAPTLPRASPSQQQPQFVTVTKAVKIKILYGETMIPAGTKVRVLSHDAQTVTVNYLDGTYAIPISSTDFR